MTEQMAGFPYWQFQFGENGESVSIPALPALVTDLQTAGITDLMIFSHGWNNSLDAARDLYARFFGEIAPLVAADNPRLVRPDARLGVVGVIWPSLLWADEPTPGSGATSTGAVAAAAMSSASPAPATPVVSDAVLVENLKAVFTTPAQGAALDQLATLLQTRPDDDASLARFQQLMAVLVPSASSAAAPEDNAQQALVVVDYHDVFERMATAAQLAGVQPAGDTGGAAGLGSGLASLWDGAKEALRQASYFSMKQRAGVVGQRGLGPVVASLHAQLPALRIHLIGHSFGARLVSYSLSGLPPEAQGSASPIKSLTLMQGAFSHFAFAAALPQAPGRAGALNGMSARVDGPLVASFTNFDTALGVMYPWASMVSGQDASDASDPLYPWGAMGHDGAQSVNASTIAYGPPGTQYPFAAGHFFDLDGNQVIVAGGPPGGAHGDICHPETGWAVLAAAGLAAV